MTAADARLEAWIRQARSDLEASRAGGAECHRRYWLQQACEKGIKALGLILWRPDPQLDGQFRAHFLHRHSPLAQLEQQVAADSSVPRPLKQLLRQIEAELDKLDGDGLLRRVDATTPTTNPRDFSYRYPFEDLDGSDVAPCDLDRSRWDTYQGNATGVIAAVERFLRAVEKRREQGRRSP